MPPFEFASEWSEYGICNRTKDGWSTYTWRSICRHFDRESAS